MTLVRQHGIQRLPGGEPDLRILRILLPLAAGDVQQAFPNSFLELDSNDGFVHHFPRIVVMRVSISIIFVEPGWDVSLTVQYTPDINMILTLDIKHQVRISLYRPTAESW